MSESRVDIERLFGLSANTSQYAYTDRHDFLAVQSREYDLLLSDPDRSRSEYIVFHGVTPKILQAELESDEDDSLHIESFFPRLNVAIAKMPSTPHEVAYTTLSGSFTLKLNAMGGLHKNLISVGRARVQGDDRAKEPDLSYIPRHPPKGRDRHWPTFLVETGYSQNIRKLHDVANWWLTRSNGEVQVVVLIAINQKSKQITFEKWLPGGTPNMDYLTVLSQETGKHAISASNKGPLVISFEDIFLRPKEGNKEKDVTFEISDLEEVASCVWTAQFEED